MKKLWILLVLFFTAACGTEGGEEINGQTPDQVAVEWVTADLQNDDRKLASMLLPKVKKENEEYLRNEIAREEKTNWELNSNYRLTEWKVDDNTFFYIAEYKHPIVGMKEEKVKVVRTSHGWKVANLLYPKDFDSRIKDTEPHVIKEMDQQ